MLATAGVVGSGTVAVLAHADTVAKSGTSTATSTSTGSTSTGSTSTGSTPTVNAGSGSIPQAQSSGS
jgi:hypothetical protein